MNRFRRLRTIQELENELQRIENEGNMDPLVQIDARERRIQIISEQGNYLTLYHFISLIN